MNHTKQRERLRAILAGSTCVSPASVYDPLSARIAEQAGFEVGLLSGSVVGSTTLAAPDLALQTITEFADQVRRVMRVCDLSLLVDADNGYGNALHAMRTVQELEHAGVSAVSIEDLALPASFGQARNEERLVSLEEAAAKLRAAIAARSDPALVIVGRTASLEIEGFERMLARVRAYAGTGIDGVFVVGLRTVEQLREVHEATQLPIVLGSTPGLIGNVEAAVAGARIALKGHLPVNAAVKALREVYARLHAGESPAEIGLDLASAEQMAELTRSATYDAWLQDFSRE